MIDRQTAGRVNVITHLHTDASNADASEMDRITDAIHRIAGAETPMTWRECFTPIEKFLRIVRAGRTLRGPLHMCVVTDHMRSRSHRFPVGHLVAAASDHRLALGAEMRTRARDVDGVYRKAPEIIAYGGVQPVEGPFGPYYGLSSALLEELWDTCLDDDRKELCTRRAHEFLLRHGIAHGLSHPFDGHELSLEGTFRLISEFTFIEVVNGGYFEPSTRVLDAYVRLHNAVVAGASLPDEVLTDTGRRLLRHIRARGRFLCPLSGSDAHIYDFDRVVLSFELPAGKTSRTIRPGDLFAALLAEEEGGGAPRTASPQRPRASGAHPLTAPARLVNLGKPASPTRQLSDIIFIIIRNWWLNVPYFTPRTVARTLAATAQITTDELTQRSAQRRKLAGALRDEFDPERLLPLLTYPEAPALRPPLRVVEPVVGAS
jgi:hypothetical protein